MSVEVAGLIAGILVVIYNIRVASAMRNGRPRGPFV
jgi:hypothetical protein